MDRQVWLEILCNNELEVLIPLISSFMCLPNPLLSWADRRRQTFLRYYFERRIGVWGWVDYTLPRYSERQFKEHFRMTRPTFEVGM